MRRNLEKFMRSADNERKKAYCKKKRMMLSRKMFRVQRRTRENFFRRENVIGEKM